MTVYSEAGKYKCRYLGEDYERFVFAGDEESAAEEFVRYMESDAASYPVASEIETAMVEVNGKVYKVRGASEPQYRARYITTA